ncbi:hypothetical protein V8B97DRAFT_1979887 [Scleroderma yunnanense]
MAEGALNVMVMGETGVGKSSVVNLIAGGPLAEVSPDASVCTMVTTRYLARTGSVSIHIWEVAGFNQPENTTAKDVFVTDVDLGPILSDRKAAVDLVLFCMRGKKLTKTTTRIFDLVKTMFWGDVPVILVITHLEMEKEDMESWWVRNETYLTREGVVGTAHVCVTGLREKKWSQKSEQSRQTLLATLENHYLLRQNRAFEPFFLGYLRRMGNFNQKGRKLEKVLIKRYKLDQSTARRLATSATAAKA